MPCLSLPLRSPASLVELHPAAILSCLMHERWNQTTSQAKGLQTIQFQAAVLCSEDHTTLLCVGRKVHAASVLLCFTLVVQGTKHIKIKGMEMQAGEDEPKHCRHTCFSSLTLRKLTSGPDTRNHVSPTPAVHGQ